MEYILPLKYMRTENQNKVFMPSCSSCGRKHPPFIMDVWGEKQLKMAFYETLLRDNGYENWKGTAYIVVHGLNKNQHDLKRARVILGWTGTLLDIKKYIKTAKQLCESA